MIPYFQQLDWNTLPPIIIIKSIKGTIHQHYVTHLFDMEIHQTKIQTFMEAILLNAIKYLTYIVLKQKNCQAHVPLE
jgi:hypothetical protein